MDFIIDTTGDDGLQIKTELLDEDVKPYFIDSSDRTEAILKLFDSKKQELDGKKSAEEEIQSKLHYLKIDNLFDEFFEDMKWTHPLIVKQKKKKRLLFHFDQLDMETGKLKSKLGAVDVDKEMKKSVLQPGIEQRRRMPQYHVSERRLKALRKKKREKTAGAEWFSLRAPELTEERARDLQLLKMRSALHSDRFYKNNDMEHLPKYFQVGTIMDSPLDHVNERLTRKQRKRTLVDELLADQDTQQHNKRKYAEIIQQRRAATYHTHMRDRRRRNKDALKRGRNTGSRAGKQQA